MSPHVSSLVPPSEHAGDVVADCEIDAVGAVLVAGNGVSRVDMDLSGSAMLFALFKNTISSFSRP